MGTEAFSTPLAFAGFIAAFALAGGLVLGYDAQRHPRWRSLVRRWVGGPALSWVDWPLLTGVAALAFATAASVTWAVGGYGCTPTGPSDLTTLVTSGQQFLHGGDPFTITACGFAGNPVPTGGASVLFDALGSLAGSIGVLVVWGAVSVAAIPLVWSLGGTERRAATVFVLVSFLYLPVVAAQVDGASLSIAPVAVLVFLYLGRRGWGRAAAVGGFLATGRFPSLFPILGAAGRTGGRRVAVTATAFAVFAAVTVAAAAAYGSRFTGPVFFAQFTRSHFALNYWGLLEGEGWLQPSLALTLAQAALTLALVGVCWFRARTEVGAVAIVLTGTLLLTQYLAFTELVFLVPVALAGHRARWWLWGIGAVASTNYLLAMRSLAGFGGPFLLSYLLDLALTALLLGLLGDLLRSEVGAPRPGPQCRDAGGPPAR